MDALRFIRLVLWAAFRHSAGLAQDAIFFAVAAVGWAIIFARYLGVEMNADGIFSLLGSPRFYALALGGIFLTRLLCAPYWVWRDEKKNTAGALVQRGGMDMREIIALNDHSSAIREQANEMRLARQQEKSFEGLYADIRVADSAELIELFHSYDSKLSGLLSSGILKAWSRKNGDSRLLPLDAGIWATHKLQFYPSSIGSVPKGINQTFLRPVMGGSSSPYFDICLNVSQVKRIWPSLPNIAPTEMTL